MSKLNLMAIVALGMLLAVQTLRLHRLQTRPVDSAILDSQTRAGAALSEDPWPETGSHGESTQIPVAELGPIPTESASSLENLAANHEFPPETGTQSAIRIQPALGDVPSKGAADTKTPSLGKDRKEGRLRARELIREAQYFRETGNYEMAVELLHQSLELEPRNWRTYSQLANLYGQMGRLEDKTQVYLDWSDALPESPNPHLHLARVFERAGLDLDASDELQQGRELTGSDARVLGRIARLYRDLGLRNEEESVLTEWTERAPDSLPARLSLARYYRETGLDELAIAEYQAASVLAPDDAQIFVDMARLFVATGRDEEATNSLLTAHDLRPDDLYVQLEIAGSYRRRDELETALQYYQNVVDARPDSPLAIRAQRAINRLAGSLAQ